MNTFSALKRDAVCSLVFSGYPTIVIASTGRAGSTLLYNAIADGLVKCRFPVNQQAMVSRRVRRWCSGFVPRLDELASCHCVVAKTHDLLQAGPEEGCKYVFIYGDPLESAKSVQLVVERYGQHWFDQHQFHLRGEGSYRDLFRSDVLNYRNQMKSWMTASRSDLICIDYEDLWQERTRLSRFLGFDVALPPRYPRAIKHPEPAIVPELFVRMRALKETLKLQYQLATRMEGPVRDYHGSDPVSSCRVHARGGPSASAARASISATAAG